MQIKLSIQFLTNGSGISYDLLELIKSFEILWMSFVDRLDEDRPK